MKYFFDCEFLQNGGQKIDLVSIGFVREDGQTFYMESSEFNEGSANDFVKKEVLPRLGPREKRRPRAEIRKELLAWIGQDIPTFVAYYAAYDAVCLFELLGSFEAMPKGWPKLVWDLKQDILKLGNPDLPNQDKKGEHNALSDAHWLKDAYWFLHGRYGLTIPEHGAKASPGALETYSEIMKSLGEKPVVEMIGDNTVDNLLADLRRTTSIEVGQFVGGLLNGSVNQFAYAYSMPQYDEFKRSLENMCVRYKVMDGMEQGDVCLKVTAMFKDIFTSTYGALGPEAADLMAVKYAKQMIDYMKAQSPQIADLSLPTPKVY